MMKRVLKGFGWIVVLGCQVVETIFTLNLGAFHLFLTLSRAKLTASVLHLTDWLLYLSGITFLSITLLHILSFWRTIKMLCSDVKAVSKPMKTIMSRPHIHETRKDSNTIKPYPLPSNATHRSLRRQWLLFILTSPWYLWKNLFGLNGLLGLNGKYYEPFFRFREFIEVVLQTYQLYMLSSAVSVRWINQLAVGIVVSNCFFTPFVYFTIDGRLSSQLIKFINIAADLCLDFGCSVVLTSVTLYPILMSYDFSTGFPKGDLGYDDEWINDATAVIHQVLVTSVLDYISTMMPHISFLHSLSSLRYLAKVLQSRKMIPEGSNQTNEIKRTVSTRNGIRSSRLFHLCLIATGASLIYLDNVAQNYQLDRVPGCRRYRPAWFATEVPCTILQVNCYLQNITGTKEELTSIFLQLDTRYLTSMVITHCPALTIPDSINRFHELSDFNLFNCSIQSWPDSAALTNINHPMLTYISIYYSNLSTIPPGLAQEPVPHGLTYFIIHRSNITEISSKFETVWSKHVFVTFAIEHTRIKKPPMVKAYEFICSSNEIEHIEDTFSSNAVFQSLTLSGNPITKLPSSLGNLDSLKDLYVEHTMVSSIESDIQKWIKTKGNMASFYGSPFCQNQSLSAWCTVDYNTSVQSAQVNAVLAQRTIDFQKDLYTKAKIN